MSSKFEQWMDGETDDLLLHMTDTAEVPDSGRADRKKRLDELRREVDESARGQRVIAKERAAFYRIYTIVAVTSCIALVGVLLFIVAYLPRHGVQNPQTLPVVTRYVTKGLEETGAINVVSGMILDYRAFDTLGESHVLFTALICVMILLRLDTKNMRPVNEDYNEIRWDRYHEVYSDSVLHRVGMVLVPLLSGLFG